MSFKSLAFVNFQSPQQIQDAVQMDFRLLGPSPEAIAQKVGEVLPDGYPIPPKDDPARVQRRERTQLMKQKFVSVLTAMYQRKQNRPDMDGYGFPRSITMVLNHLCPDEKTYDELRNTMLTGTPREKAIAVLEAINSVQDELKRLEDLPLSTITDQQIAENFESLFKMGQVTEQLEALANNNNLAFTPGERKWLVGLEQRYGAAGFSTFNRAEVIASPYYELFPSERFSGMDILDLTERLGDDVGFRFTSDYLVSRVNPNFTLISAQWQNEIENHEMRGYTADQIVWMDQDGQKLELDRTGAVPRPPDDELRMGRPLVAQYPDGQIKVFTGSMNGDDFGMRTQGPEALVEQDMKKSLDDLSRKLDAAQPILMFTGSKEFKNVRSAMEKVQKNLQTLGSHPTPYQEEQLRKQMEELEKVSQAYLTYKGTEEGKNDREQKRIDAVKAVRDFAKRKLVQLDLVEQNIPDAREAEALGDLKKGKGSWRGGAHQASMAADPEQAAKARAELEQAKSPQEEQAKSPQEMPEKSLEEMLKAYKKIKLPRSSERVEGLYQNTVDRITPLLNQTSAEPLTGASAQDVRTAMAQMILVDMVLKERVSNMFDSSKSEMKVGPLESFLDRDIAGKPGMTMMLQNIQNSQVFLEMTENLSGQSFRDFCTGNKARNVSGKILAELFPHKEQIKAAQQTQVNKTAVQNAPKEQKQNVPQAGGK